MKNVKKMFLERKFSMRYFLMLLVAIASVVAIQLCSPIEAKAKSTAPEVGYSENRQLMFVPEYKTFGEFVVKDMSKNAKVTLKVSNKKIASAKWDKRQNIVWVTAKKPGTVKVTLKIVQNKKTYTYTSKMTWVKYNNPLKSLSVGKTKYKVSYFDKNTTAAMKKVKGSQTLKVSLKKGYKLKNLAISRGGKYTAIQNGAKINFTQKGSNNTVVFISYQDPEGNNGTLRLFADKSNHEW